MSQPPPSIVRRVGDLLASPRARLLVPLVGAVLTAPSLLTGLAFEDVFLRFKARGFLGTSLGERLDLFSFFPSDPPLKAHLTDAGVFPWFAAPEMGIRFFRPLSAALHVVDFTLFDGQPWVMHLESVVLYAALVALAAATYRRLLPASVAMLAALLYAVDHGHGIPVGWLSNRNALIATVGGFAAIVAHDRWRRDGRRAGMVAGPLAFALALLGGESGVGAMAYIVAHAVTLDPAPRRKRALAVVPYVAIAVAWQLAYRRLGYGAHGSGTYLDPLADPAGFARALPGRAMALVLGELALPPAALYNALPNPGKLGILALGVVFVLYVVRALAPMWRASAALRFFACGGVLSLAPAVVAIPDDRLCLFVGLGAFGVVAAVIGDLRAPAPDGAPCALRRLWIALHLVLSPMLLPITSVAMPALSRPFDPPPASPTLAEQTVVIVNAPSVVYGAMPWLFPIDATRPIPPHVRALAGALGAVDVLREDARTLLVELAPGAMPDPLMELFRDNRRHPLRAAETIVVGGMHAEVVRVGAGGVPLAVRYRFDRDLDDPSFRWIAWDNGMTDTRPPPIGARRTFGVGPVTR